MTSGRLKQPGRPTMEDESILARYEQSNRAGKPMTVKKKPKPMQGSEAGYRMYPACHACYQPVAEKAVPYCDSCLASGAAGRHLAMKQRMGV